MIKMKITPADFAKSFYYIGPGYDIEPLLRFTHLTDTFIYTNLFLRRRDVLSWYDKQFDRHPDIEVLSRDILHGFDETRNFALHPDCTSHLMQPTFLEANELSDYRNAFDRALDRPQWAVTYRLKRKSSGREITLHYLTAEGLASYIALSHNGRYAPKILATIRTDVLENPRGLMNRFFENSAVKKPLLWVRGFMPLPPEFTDFIWGEIHKRTENNVLDPVGVFNHVGLCFNHKWICGNFKLDDLTDTRHCKGFVTDKTAQTIVHSPSISKPTGDARHRLVRATLLSGDIGIRDQDICVVPEKIAAQIQGLNAQCITWESIVCPQPALWTGRNGYLSAAEQLRILKQHLQQYPSAPDTTIHIIPHCLEDEGAQYFAEITTWSMQTVTYVTGLLDFIDLAEPPQTS